MYSVPSKCLRPIVETSNESNTTSVHKHGNHSPPRVALHIPWVHGYSFYDPYLCVLLVWACYSGEMSVCTDFGC